MDGKEEERLPELYAVMFNDFVECICEAGTTEDEAYAHAARIKREYIAQNPYVSQSILYVRPVQVRQVRRPT